MPQVNPATEDVQPLDPAQLNTYFVLLESVSLLQYRLEQQLRTEGGIS